MLTYENTGVRQTARGRIKIFQDAKLDEREEKEDGRHNR
jgi:hypothetical protein